MPNCRKFRIWQFNKGFTLIELLVVIAIIGILASFAVASFTSAQAKGRDSRRKADLDAIKKALELFKGDTTGAAYYPLAITGAGTELATTYIRAVPTDPSSSSTNYIYSASGGTCNASTVAGANCNTFTLTACLENNNEPVGGNVLAKPAGGPGSTCTGTKIYQVSPP